MDLVYIFRHSCHADEELQFSLRSVAAHCRWIRKVWIFGDRPEWLTQNNEKIEHVPHEQLAWLGGYQLPMTNAFAMMHVMALHPELAPEFLWFCDDYILLKPLTWELAQKKRYVQDMNSITNRGRGKFKEALWRTYDSVKQKGLPGLNFEVHIPIYFTKRQVLAAVKEFRHEITDDRFAGPLAQTAVLNHALAEEQFEVNRLADESIHAGFHWKSFPYEEIQARCSGKLFLNYDDSAYDQNMKQFLNERFPQPSCYELTAASQHAELQAS